MIVCIAGPRDFHDYKVVCEAIEKSGYEITEVVSGKAKGVDALGEKWAEENGVPVTPFPAEWSNLNLPNAKVKTNKYGTYNATAGFHRNEQMAKYADKLIAIDLGSPGAGNMIENMKKEGKPYFVYDPRSVSDEEDVDYTF